MAYPYSGQPIHYPYDHIYIPPPQPPQPCHRIHPDRPLRGSHRPRVDVIVRSNPELPVARRRKEPAEQPCAPDLFFCAEMGMLVRSRSLKHKTIRTLMDEVSSHLRQAGILTHVHNRDETPPESHRDWTIMDDITIPSQVSDSRFGVKIVSPMLHFAPEHRAIWLALFESVMRTLHLYFEVTGNHQCGTHIHVVPARGYWHLEETKRLARSTLYFERCFDALVPPYRRRSVWAKSNRHNKFFGGLRFSECMKSIDDVKDFIGLTTRMNMAAADSPSGEALGKTRDFVHSTFRWDFTSIGKNGFGPITFRQPPGFSDSQQIIRWIMIVGSFTRLNCMMYKIEPSKRPVLSQLGEWLSFEARMAGFASPYVESMKAVFRQADCVDYSVGAGKDAEIIMKDEASRLKWMEMADWNSGERKFDEWLRHKFAKRARKTERL